jgi:large subunit ribosomal protein L23
VKQVNTLRVLGKARRRGYVAGKTPDWKKAMVTLHEGNTIELL